MVISSFYGPPSNTDESYLTKVHKELQQLRSASKKSVFILGGDFNVPDISWKENSITSSKHYPRRFSQTFLNVASDLSLEQMVDFPTQDENTLNLIFTSHTSFQERCEPLPPISDKSDHDIGLFDTSHQPVRARPKRQTVLLWKKSDSEGIQNAFIIYSDKFFSTTFNTVNSMWEDIKTTIDQIIKDHVPTKRIAARHTHPWINSKLRCTTRRKIEPWGNQKNTKKCYWLGEVKKNKESDSERPKDCTQEVYGRCDQ